MRSLVQGEGTTRRRRRAAVCVITLAAVLSMVSLALAAVPALAADPATTTMTVPGDTTTTTVPKDTTTTTVPADTTTTTVPADTTTTTVPADTTTTTVPADTTTPSDPPGDAGSDLSPAETLAPRPAFSSLSGSQRAVLQQLQTANDTLATRRFALFDLAHQVATAKDLLKAARVRESAAVKREIFGLLGAALYRNDDTAQALSVLDPSDADYLGRALAHAQSEVTVLDARAVVLDEFTRRLESDGKSAQRARVQAQASLAALNVQVAAQTQSVNDAVAASDDAESAVTSAFGSGAGLRPQPDGITNALATAQAGQPDPIFVAGFAPPIPGAALGSPYGIRMDPLGGGAGFHPGLDFDADSGMQIHAAAAGVVVMAGDCGGYGYCVVIDHGSSVATVYGHQSRLLCQVGDQVAAGQVIGLVGSTGKSTGPHLHFEVRLHGLPIDPVPTLTA